MEGIKFQISLKVWELGHSTKNLPPIFFSMILAQQRSHILFLRVMFARGRFIEKKNCGSFFAGMS